MLVVMAGLMGMWASSANAQPGPCTPGVDCDNEMIAGTVTASVGSNVIVPLDISKASVAYAGFNATVQWSDVGAGIIDWTGTATYTGLNGMSLDAAPTETPDGGGANLDWLQSGSARLSGTGSATGTAINMEFHCNSVGVVTLTLVPPAGGVDYTSTLGPSGAIETGLTAGQITCAEPADIQTVKTGPAAVPAGVPFDWVSTVHNAGPFSALGVTIGDNLPENPPDPQPPDTTSVPMKILNSVTMLYNGVPTPCVPGYLPLFVHPVTAVVYSNIVLCDLASAGHPIMAPSDTVVLTVNVTAPLYDEGKLNVNVTQAGSLGGTPDPDESNEADCAPLGLDPGNLGCAMTMVLNSAMTISKVADKNPAIVGDTVTWTVTANCSASGSPCADATGTTGPTIVDTVDANQTVTGASMVGGTCSNTASTATCTPTLPMNPGTSVAMDVVTTVVGSAGFSCSDSATVTYGEPSEATAEASITCNPPGPIDVEMIKDTDTDVSVIDDDVNLWLCDAPWPACAANGAGHLDIFENVTGANLDPDGIGAYEFQIKFDHKIFDITVEDLSWLSNGGTRTVDCSMSIVTENWILWGCVSSGPTPGQTVNGAAAVIHVLPEPDLKYRITPGNNNGVFRVILDENCELADVWGHPLANPDGSPADGVVTGGLVAVCSDMGITVRILEGDLNLDCSVGVEDQQAIAWRYGSSFGTLLYDPWFDLEPALKDFDIDIKDLQKVFGRDGSTCGDPIPAQDPVPFP